MISVSGIIRKLREDSCVTQKELAHAINTPQQYISKIENNQVLPSLRTIDKICRALNYKMTLLFEKEESPNINEAH